MDTVVLNYLLEIFILVLAVSKSIIEIGNGKPGWFAHTRYLISQGNCTIASSSFLVLPVTAVSNELQQGWDGQKGFSVNLAQGVTFIVGVGFYNHVEDYKLVSQHHNYLTFFR